MSKLIAIRLPDDIAQEIERRTASLARGQSHFIVNALRVYLEKIEPGNRESWEQFGKGVELPPAEFEPCKKEGHRGFTRSDGYWCITCSKMYRDHKPPRSSS